MQRKLKSVFRRSSKSRRSSGQHEYTGNHSDHAKTTTTSVDRRGVSSDQRNSNSVGSSITGSVHTGRSRPVSSIYDDSQQQAHTKDVLTNDPTNPSEPVGGDIANDYKAYLPALSPVRDEHSTEYLAPIIRDGPENKEQNGIRREENVADRNIMQHSGNGAKKASSSPPGAAQAIEKPHMSETDRAAPEPQHILHATIDGTADGEETALAKELRKSGVADLRNTIDTYSEITWAPAVTHEVIKPHQHEIIQHKIYREIHNYEHFHRIQPVRMTEVLPPRHWIPNPDGEGLIEISAEELPARTGENRWWSICEHSTPHARQTTMPKYRTEPEIIEKGTYMTEEGFERKETIIIHPPTLADLTGYGGPVQAMHFDHKTGKSWMGKLTTMDKLQELQQELDRAPDVQAFKMDGLAETLPRVASNSTREDSNFMPPRKPVNGHSSTTHI